MLSSFERGFTSSQPFLSSLLRFRTFFGRLLCWIVDWLDWFCTGIQWPILSWSLQNQSNQSALLIFKGLLVHWNCSHFFAIWNRVFSFSSATGLVMKRTNPGEMLQDWEPMGVPPLRTLILRNPVPYLIVVHRKTSLSSRLSWIVDDQKLAESRE